ncbi:hypothetical protein HDU82_004491 [Entophlyctis luteolus]|nr:hypothetical protein HDU82_004491 [Entophlyctis luteolus]
MTYQHAHSTEFAQPFILRILFVLGNATVCTTPDDSNMFDLKAFLPYCGDFVALMWQYSRRVLQRILKQPEAESDSSASTIDECCLEETSQIQNSGKPQREGGEIDRDILVKILRLLSNISVDREVGKEIAEMIEVEILLDLIGTVPLMLHENTEIVEQACRIYSNVCRSNHTREFLNWMADMHGGIEMILLLVAHYSNIGITADVDEDERYSSQQIVLNSCGTLVNVFSVSHAGITSCSAKFAQCEGVDM